VRRDEGEFRPLTPTSSAGKDLPARRGRRGARVEAGGSGVGPRGVGEMLDLALEVFRARFGTLVGLSALLWVPVRIAQPFIGLHRWGERSPEDASIALVFSLLFNTISASVVTALVNALVALLVAAHLEGRELSYLDALRSAVSRSFALLLIAFLSAVLTSAGLFCVCLLCLPGVYLAYKLFAAPVVCVVERAGVADSLSRSFELARDRLLPWLGLTVVVFFLTLPLGSVSALTDDVNLHDWLVRTLGISGSALDWAAVPFTSLFLGVASALHGVAATVWYFDCRARREGADLAARLQRLQAVASAEVAT
jgi:hypothetical protein